MKRQSWKIESDGATCHVSYTFSRTRGISVSIDGEEFKLPVGFLGLKAARREIFRACDEQAILVVDKRGHAKLLFGGEEISEA